MHKIFFIFLLFGFTACATLRPEPHLLEFSGVYQAVQDGSDPLTCFCSKSGYLNACGSLYIPLCLEGLYFDEDCVNVTVKGYYQYLQPTSRTHPDCTDTEHRVFVVSEVICRD